MSFSKLGLAPAILAALEKTGYTTPTPIQAAAIPEITAGHDLIGIAQTGTGKTAAFVLPILSRLAKAPPTRGTRALILAPTRELVVQIEENARAYASQLSLKITTIFGGVSERPQIAALREGAQIVIATPGRLLDLIKQRHAQFGHLQHLVLDEADRMLDMGFIPDIRRIVNALPPKRQTLLFSATLSREIESLTHEFLYKPKTVEIGRRSNPAATVSQSVYEVPQHLKSPLLLHLLQESTLNMVLVFTRTKHGADRIARVMERQGISTATLHSNRSQNQRLRALNDFRNGTVRVLVATDIAARGIDVDGISHVINYDFPMHAEDYVHRIGRTGRAEAIGDAISFIGGRDDLDSLRTLERMIGKGIERKKADGFDYHAQAPARQPEARQQQPRNRPREARTAEGGNRRPTAKSGGRKRTANAKASVGSALAGVPGGMTWRPRTGRGGR